MPTHALCLLMAVAPAWHLAPLDATSAKTTVRLWHQLYKARRQAHDFTPLLSPQTRDAYLAAVRYDEIRAIAACSVPDDPPPDSADDNDDDHPLLRLECVAAHPDHPNAVAELVHLLHEDGHVRWDASTVRGQPRVYLEMLVAAAEAE